MKVTGQVYGPVQPRTRDETLKSGVDLLRVIALRRCNDAMTNAPLFVG